MSQEKAQKISKDVVEDKFIQGTVAALDVVALYDQPVIFKEIVESAGIKKVLAEIKKNGSERSKKIAKQEFREKQRYICL
ncbi:MAG: hypothetical protein PHW62_00310 [Candidatus Ratteibacteria bacterium]|nr:hypothetical protein [Candidatus Ratteibacteria bacterium]